MANMPKLNKYIDPMVDYGFKVIFKESGKKQLLIRPINAVFGLDIVDIDITESRNWLTRHASSISSPCAKTRPAN